MSGSGSPNASDGLERRYRRLLAWYPAEHRRVHGQEMIGVLLASADSGRRRPGLAETFDLIRGGLRIRFRPRTYDGIDAGWTDTLAVASLAIPTMVVILYAAISAWLTYRIRLGIAPVGLIVYLIAFPLLMALPPVLALCGLRRMALPFYFIPLLWLGYKSAPVVSAGDGAPFLAYLIAAVAFVLSPGPRRAVQIMSAKTWAVVCGIGLAMFAPEVIVKLPAMQWPFSVNKSYFAPYGSAQLLIVVSLTLIAMGAAIGLFRTLPSPVGRRLLMLMAVAAYPGAAAFALPGAGSIEPIGAIEFVYVPTATLACVAVGLVWKSRRQARPQPPQQAKD
jgi:hypothetical protein